MSEDKEKKRQKAKEALIDIIYFFKEERDEELGIIGSEMILDFLSKCWEREFTIRLWMM